VTLALGSWYCPWYIGVRGALYTTVMPPSNPNLLKQFNFIVLHFYEVNGLN
jgi:hypothetical protein